ncbi:hypothetical protein, partial [Bartonella bovis]|uniref:hypothetical protein n=1 Tax=Bartonella bovis TaxID=155194 RepID=UPI001957009C
HLVYLRRFEGVWSCGPHSYCAVSLYTTTVSEPENSIGFKSHIGISKQDLELSSTVEGVDHQLDGDHAM